MGLPLSRPHGSAAGKIGIYEYRKIWEQSVMRGNRRPELSLTKWSLPPLGLCKVNVDVSTRITGVTSVGVVIGDHSGQVMEAFGVNYAQGFDPAKGEVLAVRRKLEAALAMGMDEITIESDSQLVVEGPNIGVGDLSTMASVIEDCIEMTKPFTNVHYSWIRAEANKATHDSRDDSLFVRMSSNGSD
ncbi:hypothetical protein Droror1_Dr00024227 [Drosera rotundifolia]